LQHNFRSSRLARLYTKKIHEGNPNWQASLTMSQLTPWLMEPGGSMPHSQGLSNNSYP
jgi:hypothetical protein